MTSNQILQKKKKKKRKPSLQVKGFKKASFFRKNTTRVFKINMHLFEIEIVTSFLLAKTNKGWRFF
ncbi:hypothetical protein BWG23_14025 [Flavobacterium oreochromis]|nr:hypothetical protein BWG23_14025 [Flavobacterium oreochromis]